MLIGRALTKLFHGRPVLDGVELSCGPGEACAILGENGAGKSTLLRVCAGLIEPDSGSITIQGHELSGGGVAARALLGYVPDGTQSLPELSLRELAELVRALKRAPADAAAQRELFGWRERLALEAAWHQRLSSLSFGQRKRACLLAALIGDPWLLILDEPSNGLDAAGVGLMLELIEQRRRQGKATLLACNDTAFLEQLHATCHRLQQGKLQRAGRPQGAA